MTKTLPWLLVAATLLANSPSYAAGPSLSHFAHLMAEAAVGENAPEVAADFATGISVGPLPLQFEKTTLKDVLTAFGGTINMTGEATGTVSWICYTRVGHSPGKPPVTVWFISDDQSLGLKMVVAQETNAAAHDGCATAPVGLTLGSGSLQPLGATAAALKKQFGSLPYDRVHNVYFDSTRPAGDQSGKSVYQRLGYAMKGGRVVGVAVSQSTN